MALVVAAVPVWIMLKGFLTPAALLDVNAAV
jgi:hypothetical protein